MSSTDTPTVTAPAVPTGTIPPRRRGRHGERFAKIGFVVPAALLMVALFGYPVVKNLTMSFQDYSLKTFFTGKAPFVGLENYVQVVTDPIFTKAMANTAIFTVINAVLVRPLPYPDPSRLVLVWSSNESRHRERNTVSPADFQDWRAQNDVFDEAGRPLGSFKKEFGASLLRSTWHLEAPGLQALGRER